jgi:hypothetical protein
MLADMSTPRILPRLAHASAQTNEHKPSSSTQKKPQNQTSQNSPQGNDSFAYSRPRYVQPTVIKNLKLEQNNFFSKLFKPV